MIVPNRGDRIERRRAGVAQWGTVHYADQLQALVKWDDGSSSSLRLDRDQFTIVRSSWAYAGSLTPDRAA